MVHLLSYSVQLIHMLKPTIFLYFSVGSRVPQKNNSLHEVDGGGIFFC